MTLLDDLSDDELLARLVNRGLPAEDARFWVRYRNVPRFAVAIAEALERKRA